MDMLTNTFAAAAALPIRRQAFIERWMTGTSNKGKESVQVVLLHVLHLCFFSPTFHSYSSALPP